VNLQDFSQWWRWVPGARWSEPAGPGSTLEGKADHPVVQVSCTDAGAYAQWVGKDLPTEAEWEYAARAGLHQTTYTWGNELKPNGVLMANTWQGHFPYDNHGANGWIGTPPVGSFPRNGFDLYDMTGNVWEWTTDYYHPKHDAVTDSCCAPTNPRGANPVGSAEPGSSIPRRVLKGGSHLCAPEYCLRYRPACPLTASRRHRDHPHRLPLHPTDRQRGDPAREPAGTVAGPSRGPLAGPAGHRRDHGPAQPGARGWFTRLRAHAFATDTRAADAVAMLLTTSGIGMCVIRPAASRFSRRWWFSAVSLWMLAIASSR